MAERGDGEGARGVWAIDHGDKVTESDNESDECEKRVRQNERGVQRGRGQKRARG